MRQRTYGPRQMEAATGLARWQAERAIDRGLIPPGTAAGWWTQDQVEVIAARAREIETAAVGAHPGYGARRVAEALTAAMNGAGTAGPGAPADGVRGPAGDDEDQEHGDQADQAVVATEDVELLAARGELAVAGVYRGRVLYDPAAVRAPDPALVTAARRVAAQRAEVTGDDGDLRGDGIVVLDELSPGKILERAGAANEAADHGDRLVPGQRDQETEHTTALHLDADEDESDGTGEPRGDGDLVTVWEAARELGVGPADVEYVATVGWLAPADERDVAGHPAVLYRVGDVRALPDQWPQVRWDRDVRGAPPGAPRVLREWTRLGGHRAQGVAELAQRVADRWQVAVWARWRPSGGWLLDWAPTSDGSPTAEDVADELTDGGDELVVGDGPHRQRVGLLSRSGQVTRWAARMLQPRAAVIVDTETTALDGHPVEIAVLDAATGETLLDTLVRPPEPITERARRVHRITDAMVAAAPELGEVWPRLVAATVGKVTLAYNADFDRAVLQRGAAHAGLAPRGLGAGWECLMRARATWSGTTSWTRLQGGGHRAAGDARAAREVLVAMAGPPDWWGPATAHPAGPDHADMLGTVRMARSHRCDTGL